MTAGVERGRVDASGVWSLGAAPGSESLRVTPVASAVNYWDFYGGATGVDPYLFPSGSDTNRGFKYLTKGTGAHTFQTNTSLTNTQFVIANTTSAVNYITVFGNTAGSGGYFQATGSDTNISMLFSAKGTGGYDFYTAGNSFTRQFSVASTASAVNYLQVTGAGTGSAPTISAQGSDATIGLYYTTKSNSSHVFYTRSLTAPQFVIGDTASAVNYLQVTGNSTGFGPSLTASGSDTNIPIYMIAKGASPIYFIGQSNNTQFAVSMTASAVNYAVVAGGATGSYVTFAAQGSDTNIDLALIPQGTGVLRFGTYTAGTIVQAGYITIKDAGGTTRRLLVG